nr:ABC transporter permease subunit [Arthrobacter sp. Br18]
MLKAAFASVNNSMEEAAAIMGAGGLYTFRRILLPAVLPTAAAIAALNFNSQLETSTASSTTTTPPCSWPTRSTNHSGCRSRPIPTAARTSTRSRTPSSTPCS